MSVNSDIRKAKEMRANAKQVLDPDAAAAFRDAAARLEKRAAKNARKVGRTSRKRSGSASSALR